MSEIALSADELRGNIKKEGITFPVSLFKRSYLFIVINTLTPFFLLLIALYIYAMKVDFLKWELIFFLFLASQRCLQTLVHDSAHNFFSSSTRLNDYFANFFVSGWIGSTVQVYRYIHFRHHKFNGSKDDPEHINWHFVNKRNGLIGHVLRYVLGLDAFRLIKKYYFSSSGKDANKNINIYNIFNFFISKFHIVFCQLILFFILFIATNNIFLYLLWLYLALTWSPMLSSLRYLVEHPGESNLTVSTDGVILERLFFAPFGFNYHFEHHLWPLLPPYHLKHAHQKLLAMGFFDRHTSYVNSSYIKSLMMREKT